MSERNGYEHGVPCWVAGVHPDPAAAASFYGGLLGWEPQELEPGQLVCRLRGREVAAIGPGPGAAADAAVWQTSVWVDDAEAAAAKVAAAGGSVLAEPFELGSAGRTAVVATGGRAVRPLGAGQAARHARGQRAGGMGDEHVAAPTRRRPSASTARSSAGRQTTSAACGCGASPASSVASRCSRCRAT